MPLQGEYEPSPSEWVRDQVATYEASGGTEGTTMRDVPVIILTTVGRTSGKLRKSPLMRVEHDGVYAAIASKGGADDHPLWYENLRHHREVMLRDGPEEWDALAREVVGPEREAWWERAVAVWPDYAEYQTKTDRTIPVVLIERVT
ncbi:MAG: nitroreductase family deazaflavin-dependent oxidoreductase [Actinomycetota bacterium]|nr:nitroreductase family deazaflavin-dependent oxidoreductase [Actinomycetota bacterium]